MNPTNLRLCDGVATILFKYDADFLTRFLDLDVPEVFFLREEHNVNKGDLVIWRKDRTVTVSRVSMPLGHPSRASAYP